MHVDMCVTYHWKYIHFGSEEPLDHAITFLVQYVLFLKTSYFNYMQFIIWYMCYEFYSTFWATLHLWSSLGVSCSYIKDYVIFSNMQFNIASLYSSKSYCSDIKLKITLSEKVKFPTLYRIWAVNNIFSELIFVGIFDLLYCKGSLP